MERLTVKIIDEAERLADQITPGLPASKIEVLPTREVTDYGDGKDFIQSSESSKHEIHYKVYLSSQEHNRVEERVEPVKWFGLSKMIKVCDELQAYFCKKETKVEILPIKIRTRKSVKLLSGFSGEPDPDEVYLKK